MADTKMTLRGEEKQGGSIALWQFGQDGRPEVVISHLGFFFQKPKISDHSVRILKDLFIML